MKFRGMKVSGLDGSKQVINVWDILQYYYCPRKVYFLKVLGVPPIYKWGIEEGEEEHKKEIKRSKERKDFFGFKHEEVEKIIYKLPLESLELGLEGKVDAVVLLKNGEVIPIEIKYSNYMNIFRGRKKQLTAYALLLEQKFDRKVTKGVLYFPKQNKLVKVSIEQGDKEALKKDIAKIRELLSSEKIPMKSSREKCIYCEVSKYCI